MRQRLEIPVTEVRRCAREGGWLLGLSLLLAACGGEARHGSRGSSEAGSTASGAAPTTGGQSSAAGGRESAGGASANGGEATGGVPEFKSSFETTQAIDGIGLWMGLGEQLPVELPPVAHDGTALHLVGDSGDGLDVFFHTALPIEGFAREVKFVAYSEEMDVLTVGIAGPSVTYFSDRAAGIPWPETEFQLGAKWKGYSFSLEDLSPAPPHEEMFGAVHFVVQPGEHYDFWIDDFTLVSRYR